MTLTPVKVLYVNKNTKYSNILCFVITFIKKTHQINFKAFNFSVSVFILKNFLLEKYGIMLSFFRYYVNMLESVIIFFCYYYRFVITFIEKLHYINFKAVNLSSNGFILKNFLLEKYGILCLFFRYKNIYTISLLHYIVITVLCYYFNMPFAAPVIPIPDSMPCSRTDPAPLPKNFLTF